VRLCGNEIARSLLEKDVRSSPVARPHSRCFPAPPHGTSSTSFIATSDRKQQQLPVSKVNTLSAPHSVRTFSTYIQYVQQRKRRKSGKTLSPTPRRRHAAPYTLQAGPPTVKGRQRGLSLSRLPPNTGAASIPFPKATRGSPASRKMLRERQRRPRSDPEAKRATQGASLQQAQHLMAM